MKKDIPGETRLIAACGLYCGACGKLLKGKCPGCKENQKAAWCQIRICCKEKGIDNCSACDIYSNPKECAKYNNFIARVFGFITGSNRAACVELIKTKGPDAFVGFMVNRGFQSIPRKYKLPD